MEECLFDDLQRYAQHPGDTLPLDSFDELFPQLAFIKLTGHPECSDDYWETDFRLHLYGSITPIDLVRKTVSRPPRRPEVGEWAEWQDFLRNYDKTRDDEAADGTASIPKDNYIGMSYSEEHHVDFFRGLTLHKHGRLTTSHGFPLSAMAEPLNNEWAIWSGAPFTPKLDIRHLRRDDPAVDETLEGCIWLFQQDKCHRSPSSAAKVICRLEVVRSLLQTVRSPVIDALRLDLSDYADTPVFDPGSFYILHQSVRGRRP